MQNGAFFGKGQFISKAGDPPAWAERTSKAAKETLTRMEAYGEEDNEDALFNELRKSDTVEARFARQLAVEEVLGRIIALLLKQPANLEVDPATVLDSLLLIIPEGFLDRLEGDMHGTAYANVFRPHPVLC